MRKQLLWLLRKLLPRPAIRRYRTSAGRCVYCGYDLAADGRNPNYCPQCGNSQLQEAHSLRRRELMLELERLQMELVLNQQERMAGSNRTRHASTIFREKNSAAGYCLDKMR